MTLMTGRPTTPALTLPKLSVPVPADALRAVLKVCSPSDLATPEPPGVW